MNFLSLSILLLAISANRMNFAPLESDIEGNVEGFNELDTVENTQGIQTTVEKHHRKKNKTNPIELIIQIQRFFLINGSNDTNANSSNPVWTIEQFERNGFNMSALLVNINNKTLMNQVAEIFTQNGLSQFVIADSNQTLTINVSLILQDLDVISAVDLLIKNGVVPGKREKRRHHLKHDKHGRKEENESNDNEGDRSKKNHKNKKNKNKNKNENENENENNGVNTGLEQINLLQSDQFTEGENDFQNKNNRRRDGEDQQGDRSGERDNHRNQDGNSQQNQNEGFINDSY